MKTWCWVVWALGATACGMDVPAARAVLVVTAPASAADCPAGGTVVSSGADDNTNGVLDADEVANRTVVCDEKTPPTVVRLVAEPVGMHCSVAGTAVESGPDRNGNGVLDDEEVSHVDYACGEQLVTRLAPAAPDAGCVAGGVALLAGRDRNHDGRLEDDEVEQRVVACGDELPGDVALHDASEVKALAGVAVITGSLTVDATMAGELVLPQLVQVRGGIEIRANAALNRVALPGLQSVDGPLVVAQDPALTALELPALRRVGGLVIDGAAALSDLSGLAALREVRGDLQVSNDAALGSIALALDRVEGGLAIDGNVQLSRVTLALAGDVGAIHIASNPQLAAVGVGGGTVGRLIATAGVTMQSNAALVHAVFDADDLGALAIWDSTRLVDVAVTGVGIAGDVWLNGVGPVRLSFTALAPDRFLIGGALRLTGPIEAIESTRPLVVRNDCLVDRSHLVAFGPDQVSEVGGRLVLSNSPRLTAIATMPVGGLEVSGDHALVDLDFQPGDQFRGDLTIVNNASLEAAPFTGLRTVIGYVTIDSNAALKSVFGPSLEVVTGALVIERNAALSDLELTSLRSAGGLAITGTTALTEIALPALERVTLFSLDLLGNAELRHLVVPVLRFADMQVFNNPRLAACEVEALFALIGGRHDQRFNDDTAVCP